MKAEKGNNLEKELQKMLTAIHPADPCVAETALKRWNSIAKPLHSLGKLEKDIIQIAGMTGDPNVHLDKKALLVMCADNGVVEEGVTQTGQEVTAIVAENFLTGNTDRLVWISFRLTLAWLQIQKSQMLRSAMEQQIS